MNAAASPAAPVFVLRAEVPEDRRFVLATWLRAEADSSAHSEGRHFSQWQHAMMGGILARPSTRIVVASPEGDDAIAGWAALGGNERAPVVYYVYVDKEARRLGVARLLLGALIDRQDVIYGARPPREKRADGWHPSSVPIPRGWKYMPRCNFLEVA